MAAAAIAFAALLLLAPAAALAGGDAPIVTGSTGNSGTLAGATAVAVAGGYAYTTAYGTGQLTAVDISNPDPAVAGSSPVANSLLNSTNITISNGYAYVVSKNRNGPCMPGPSPNCGAGTNDDGSGNSLTILDIHSDPANPSIVGTPLSDPVNLFGAYGVAVVGQLAYVAAQGCLNPPQPCPDPTVGNSFSVIDVSNPANPQILGTLRNSSLPAKWTNALKHPTSVAIEGDYAYVTAFYSDRLTVIDITDPMNPTIVASLPDTTNLNSPADVAVEGDHAYVADQNSAGPELTVVDISNPFKPTIAGSLPDSSLAGAYRIDVSGDFAYVSGSSAMSMSAVDISDPADPILAWSDPDDTYFWHTTGLSLDLADQRLIATSPYVQGQSSPVYPPFPTNTGTVTAITLEPAPISVTIAAVSEPLSLTSSTVADFQFATGNLVEAVQCALDGQPFGPCSTQTSQQYANLPLGTHTFTVEGIDAAGNTTSASYGWRIDPAVPTDVAAPTISGVAVESRTLTADPGTWLGAPAPTFAYQWQRCDAQAANCTAIAGATAATYTLAAADIGATIELSVTASNGSGATAASSGATAIVTSVPANTASPSISGTAVEGARLQATAGTWSGAPAPTIGYQWQRCDATGSNCTPIPGANADTYTIAAADVGATVAVAVTATNSAGAASATSAPTATVNSPPPPESRITKLALTRTHGKYVAHVTLDHAGTLTITLRRTKPPHGPTVEHLTRKLPAGSSRFTLKFHATPGATYALVATTNAGSKRVSFAAATR